MLIMNKFKNSHSFECRPKYKLLKANNRLVRKLSTIQFPLEVGGHALGVCAPLLEVCTHPLEVWAHPLEVCAHPLEVNAHPVEVCVHPLGVCAHTLC